MYQLHIETDFAAAHNLRGYDGECENLHGHNYKVEVDVGGESLDQSGLLLDFRELKKICEDVVGELDHCYLNDIKPFDSVNPTSENLARYICEGVQEALPDGIRVLALTCWESQKCAARYVPG